LGYGGGKVKRGGWGHKVVVGRRRIRRVVCVNNG